MKATTLMLHLVVKYHKITFRRSWPHRSQDQHVEHIFLHERVKFARPPIYGVPGSEGVHWAMATRMISSQRRQKPGPIPVLAVVFSSGYRRLCLLCQQTRKNRCSILAGGVIALRKIEGKKRNGIEAKQIQPRTKKHRHIM